MSQNVSLLEELRKKRVVDGLHSGNNRERITLITDYKSGSCATNDTNGNFHVVASIAGRSFIY